MAEAQKKSREEGALARVCKKQGDDVEDQRRRRRKESRSQEVCKCSVLSWNSENIEVPWVRCFSDRSCVEMIRMLDLYRTRVRCEPYLA